MSLIMPTTALNSSRKLTLAVRNPSLYGEATDKRRSAVIARSVKISGSQSVHPVLWLLIVTFVLQYAQMARLTTMEFA